MTTESEHRVQLCFDALPFVQLEQPTDDMCADIRFFVPQATRDEVILALRFYAEVLERRRCELLGVAEPPH